MVYIGFTRSLRHVSNSNIGCECGGKRFGIGSSSKSLVRGLRRALLFVRLVHGMNGAAMQRTKQPDIASLVRTPGGLLRTLAER